MHPCVLIVFSLFLLNLETTIANQLVAVGGGDDNGITNKCFDEERRALLHFKARLQDRFSHLSTWTAEENDCCTWSGVTCNNETHHVTELDISLCGLVGEISYPLLNLSNLYHLDLRGNSIYGTIPALIGSMTRIMYLDLSDNSLHGTIPRSIGSMTELTYLSLSGNSLYGTIPLEFGNLTNLQILFLGSSGGCRVENMEWLSRLCHLEELEMDGISLAKANHWVNVISSLQSLSLLSLEGCELSEVMYPYSSFLNSSSISFLNLGNNNLKSSMYHWLFPLTSNKLRDLRLSRNMLDGIPKYLGNLCSLEYLSVDNNSIAVKFPDFLNNLSGCTSLTLQQLYAPGSQFTGYLSDDIQKFSSLTDLYLSDNCLNGTISEKLWELPRLQLLDVSFNYLKGSISGRIGKSKPFTINLSKNSLLEGVPSTDHISNLSYVEEIDMSSCNLGPRFPKWIQTLKNLTRLDISNNSISDTIPKDFWDMWPSRLGYLNLSSNSISGVLNLSSKLGFKSVIDLSSNRFYGPIPTVPSTLISLNLSKNKFHGGISFLCQIFDGLLVFLDLSHNFLSGKLPDCLWHFKQLKVLNLGNNNLSGRLPPSIGSLIELQVLYLYKNNFSGEFPLSLKNCTNLDSLNLGANKFSGHVPIWIGENLSGLYVLILRSNFFIGTIPLQLCHLASLQILDLSMNILHGTIPSCLNNLTSMVKKGFLPPPIILSFSNTWSWISSEITYSLDNDYVDHAMIVWQGDEREFIRNMALLKSIDLSSNNLTGQIPYELTNLYELVTLNLSKNDLLGEIPWHIGEMRTLLILDLSRNKLSGQIPSSMSQMTFLGYLDVSCNNLLGKIPSSTQLQSFEPSRYNGNMGLCGPPLTKKCPGDAESEVPPVIGKSEGGGEDTDEGWGWFYVSAGTGFATGFWIACGALLVNRRGRHAFFLFYDSFKDKVYVKVVVFIANLQKVRQT